ncbi:alpha/beta hydrolase [Rhodococcus rhodnii]|nr:alpha/beta hydrolase [Rhodococcus rhodnii]
MRFDTEAVRAHRTALATARDGMMAATDGLRIDVHWHGIARDGLDDAVAQHTAEARGIAAVIDALDAMLAEFDERMSALRDAVRTIVDGEAPAAGITLAANGIASPHGELADWFTSRLHALADDAAATDAWAAREITVAAGTAPSLRDVAAELGEVAVTAQWWSRIDADTKEDAYEDDRSLGNRDGLPHADRDRYNRRHLAEALARAERQVALIHSAREAYPSEGQWREQVEPAQTHAAALRDLTATLGPDRLLTVFDDAGRVAVSLGDPDTADAITTLVPGTGANIATMRAGIDRGQAMLDAVRTLDPSANPAVVVWYGYDAPATLVEASRGAAATAAAPLLAEFQDGLRATSPGVPLTVVGHSYGTTVIGHAASGGHVLAADDVILVASPGIGVEHPTDLRFDAVDPRDNATRIHSVTAPDDPIRFVPTVVHGPQPAQTPGWGTPLTGGDPSWWSAASHSAYWERGAPTLEAMAGVMTGRVRGDASPAA